MIGKPYSESCDQNREPISRVLAPHAAGRSTVLEIGSGTGQHAVYFARLFDWLRWQTSDLPEYHAGINAWIDDSGLSNALAPLTLDCRQRWSGLNRFDLVFSANSLHIMSADAVSGLFQNLPTVMHETSLCLLYGPFNYHGAYTSDSNQRFDAWLKQRDPLSGIKDFGWLSELAAQQGMRCVEDHPMPANNRLLVYGYTV